jgi:hypothetical protein
MDLEIGVLLLGRLQVRSCYAGNIEMSTCMSSHVS